MDPHVAKLVGEDARSQEWLDTNPYPQKSGEEENCVKTAEVDALLLMRYWKDDRVFVLVRGILPPEQHVILRREMEQIRMQHARAASS